MSLFVGHRSSVGAKTGKVYGGAINNKTKRYRKDLKDGIIHDKKGKPVVNPVTGELANFDNTKKSWRAGYMQGVAESNAAVKTSAGLKANAKMPDGIKIKNVAVDESGKKLTSKQIADAYKVK